MRILIVGGSGLLGGELVRQATTAGQIVAATYLTRPGAVPGAEWLPLDVRDRKAVFGLIGAIGPDVVVNAAFRQPDWETTAVDPRAVIVRTSLIIGDGGSAHEDMVHALAAGDTDGVLFTDDVRCPVHVSDLAAALLELAGSDRAGTHHAAGADAMSRYELGRLIARRDGLDPSRLPSGRRAGTDVPGPLDVRLDCRLTQRHLTTRLRGAREFLRQPRSNGSLS
ncbi:sugar nucleotide-binding protein [Microbispora sp. H10949]|uniref:sugar nucleotide-binding protein n=1 Tax=Microbispora sp. H10949 TaxID=2729111 RepID=UPI00160139DC|nr:sugar nucleotide-binding protein [Microbispora sp. H10949]